jgi:hypothetical protein
MDNATKEARMMRQLEEIRVGFLKHARDKIPLLLELLGTVGAGDSKRLAELQFIAHRIHGGGATFNFPAIGANAGQLEELLEALIGTSPDSKIQAEALRRALDSGRRLVSAIGTAEVDSPPTDPSVSGVARRQGI